MQPKVSFIVPVYETENYLDRCVRSLINQTCKNIEIILVDDGSPDKCPEICDNWAKMDKRIQVIHKKNGGLSDSRNYGISNTTGEYICFVDSDDYVEKNLVEITYGEAKKNDADVVVYSNYLVYENGYKKIQHLTSSKPVFYGKKDIHEFFNESIGSLPKQNSDYDIGFSPWGKLYKRKIIIDNKLSFKSERDLIYEDLMFILDLVSYINCAVIKDIPLYNYWQNDDSLTRSVDLTRFSRIKKQYYFLKNNSPYKEMLFDNGETNIRFRRTMLSYIRNSVIQFNNVPGAVINIKKICNDKLCREILNDYPIASLPKYQFLFAWFLKNKMSWVLFSIIKLNSLRHTKL